MGQKHKNLFDQIITPANFERAYALTCRGKRRSLAYLQFKEYATLNLERLRREIVDGVYAPGPMRYFKVYEPKPRWISALPFRDRIAQHALNNVIEPIFDRTMLPYTFACRVGGGTHAGICHVQAQLRRTGATHFLKTDFAGYFPSIDRPMLYRRLDAKVTCPRTRDLMRRMIAPEGVGIPIGHLMSQLFANVYGTSMDDFLQHEVKPVAWARYMDDIVVLGYSSLWLREVQQRMQAHAESAMHMRFSKWQVAPISRGINFLGHRIWPRHKLLRKDSVARARRKLSTIRARGDTAAEQRFLGSWLGHARWADSHNLLTNMGLTHA